MKYNFAKLTQITASVLLGMFIFTAAQSPAEARNRHEDKARNHVVYTKPSPQPPRPSRHARPSREHRHQVRHANTQQTVVVVPSRTHAAPPPPPYRRPQQVVYQYSTYQTAPPPPPSEYLTVNNGWSVVGAAPGRYEYYDSFGRFKGTCSYRDGRYMLADAAGRLVTALIYLNN